jgi:glycosyltransferase involved in cell wall biosynthesis
VANPEVSVVLTCHKEGALLGPSLRSCGVAIAKARAEGISAEVIVIQDRCDEATLSMLQGDRAEDIIGARARVVPTDHGDPGLARNHGVSEATGRFVTFLDGDDLWGENWIVACRRFHDELGIAAILHSEVNVVFGQARLAWVHPSSLDPDLPLDPLILMNYWDAMAFAERDLCVANPFVANSLREGFGHEDWHWACSTLAHGIHHVPVPGTVHFKRARTGSQMALCNTADVVVRDNTLTTCRHLFAPAGKV